MGINQAPPAMKNRADSEILRNQKKIQNKVPMKISFKQGTTTADSGADQEPESPALGDQDQAKKPKIEELPK